MLDYVILLRSPTLKYYLIHRSSGLSIGKKVFSVLVIVDIGNHVFNYNCSERDHNPKHYRVIVYGSLALVTLMARRRCMTNIITCEQALWRNYINIVINSNTRWYAGKTAHKL